MFVLLNRNPGRKLRAGSGRKAPEIAGTWKQYFHRNFSDDLRILPIPKSYTFLHRLLTRNPLPSIPENLKRPFPSNTCHNQEFLLRSSFQIQLSTSNSWSFLPIPELQISHGWLSDHLSSLNKCKAEFWNLCTSGITRKCRNSWSFHIDAIPEF